uniref:Longin domain-containing protein n=1 Tax=Zoysia matrella TaxID=38722 RepID=A0A0C4MKH9_9POAL|nr:hypothetical protein [Zoysia matrella]
MNSRRSKSVKLVSARATKPLEVDVPEYEDPRMSSSADNTVYCCIARGRKVIYRYASSSDDDGGGGDPGTESAAALCLEHAPAHHRHFVHTSGSRSYAFLAADGHTFFAIIDPCVGSVGALQFLERVRDVFRNASNSHRNRFHDSLVPAVQRLCVAGEMPHAAFVLETWGKTRASETSTTCTSSSAVLESAAERESPREPPRRNR